MLRQFASAVLCLTLGAAPPLFSAEAPPEPVVSANPALTVIARAPDFALRDTKGNTVRLSDYRGRVVLLAFVFTTCPGVCPLISRQMSALQAALKDAGLFGRQAN